MRNRRVVWTRLLALVLPAVLEPSCIQRDWSVCSPQDECQTGYTCTADWKCLRDIDGGADGLVVVDSNSAADTVLGMDAPAWTDAPAGPAVGRDAAGPDSAPASLPPDAPVGNTYGLDGPEPDQAPVFVPPDVAVDARPDAPADAAPDAPLDEAPDLPTMGGPPDTPDPDVPHIGPTVDAAGTCSTDKGCSPQNPLCLGNRCTKCSSDNDCTGRSDTPACVAASGLCVACTANRYCIGAASTCDTTTNHCVGCVRRSDCIGTCQACTNSICTAVKGQDDPDFCAGTCDATGTCKAKKGQTCQSVAGGCVSGTSCSPDGVCCDKACSGSCEACDIATALGTCTTLGANAAPHAGHTGCTGTGTCGGKCDGTSTACAYSTSTCGTATCANRSYQAAGTCNAGVCNLPAPKSCQYDCASATGGCACPPGLTGANCDLSRFVVITPSTVGSDSSALDTSADGTVVTGNQGGNAFIWTQANGSAPLALSPSISSSVGNGINADGTVIVGQFTSFASGLPQEAFRWTKATGMVALSSSSTSKEAAMSVSGDGSTIVGYTDRFGSGSIPFRWTSGTGMAKMASVTGAAATSALRISRDGSIVLGNDYDGNDLTGDVGIMWFGSASGQILNFPVGYLDAQAIAVTSDASAVFGFYQAYAGPGIPFKWTQAAGAVNLTQSTLNIWGASDVSGDGSIMIGDAGSRGYVWDFSNGPPRLLGDILVAEGANLNGLTLYPNAISDDGNVIVGTAATDPLGTYVAFLARWR